MCKAAVLCLAALLFSPGAFAQPADEIVLRQVAANTTSAVTDAGSLLSAHERADLEALAQTARAGGIGLRLVTVPKGVEAARLLSRIGDALALGRDEILVLAGPDGAYARVPALAGQPAEIQGAFQRARRSFALGTAPGLQAMASDLISLVKERNATESRWSGAVAVLAFVLLLGLGGSLVRSMLSSSRERTLREQFLREEALDRTSGLLCELGRLTEETPEHQALFLDAWKRFNDVTRATDSTDFSQLDLFLQETLRRLRGAR